MPGIKIIISHTPSSRGHWINAYVMSSADRKGTLDLLKKCVMNDSLASSFYCSILCENI